MAQNMNGEETIAIDDTSVAEITAAVDAAVEVDVAGLATASALSAAKLVVDAIKLKTDNIPASPSTSAAVAAIPTTDHFAVLSETGPISLTATGGANPDTTVEIPATANSFSIGSCNAAKTGVLTGYCAPSTTGAGTFHVLSGEIATLSDAGFIPDFLDDGSTPPTHLYICNTDSVAGKVWVQFYK